MAETTPSAGVTSTRLRAHGVTGTLLQAGDPAATEAVVFLHGSPGNAGDWSDFLGPTGEFARAVAFDMPGFGDARTFAGFDHRVEGDYRDFLIHAMDELGLARVHLVGHDFGVPWGLAWAAARPERLASLTLINAGAMQDYRWHMYARVWQTPLLGELTQRISNRRGMRILLRRANPRLPVDFIDRMYDKYDAHTRATVLSLYRAARDPEAMLTESLATLPTTIPTLVLWGGDDPWLPARHAELQSMIWPDSRIEVLPGLGHWCFADDPRAVADLLLPFLRAQVGRSERAGGSGQAPSAPAR
ncbi:alpha/beta fold hydrolase [Nocardia bovistercoris]|uniref:Alpha/beta hydrolase n=1 Tax=Nocardia bovistercoris TaxID=2785916 RepID=A0A931I927_9NOCA|nr:alpha/beta hydrolase [Nocardia bovistercoris]MBH0777207.1 alpha/beta hydrolase [Nocardia bovistercoris]